MQDSVSPVKTKKKKSSFLDDDDFFVVKKSKKTKTKPAPATTKLAPGQTGNTIETSEASESTQSKAETQHDSLNVNANAIKASRTPSSEDRTAPFFSASETFSDSGPIDLSSFNPIERDSQIENNIETINLSDDKAEVEAEDVQELGTEIIPDEEEEDSDLRSFFKNVTRSHEDISDESKRLYNVTIKSKLGLSVVYNKQISGDTTFEKLINILSCEMREDFGLPNFWDQGVLVWVEGKSELKPMFKPSTLRIPPKRGELSNITCLYIPREHLHTFDKLYEEFFDTQDDAIDEIATDDDQPTVYSLSDSEKEDVPEAPKNEYFVIGLKGKDNKRIEAEVGPTTKIRSLLKYYLQVKGIKDAKVENCKLLFDDEELELDSVVGDTELEEDFELQVYIN